MFRRSSGTWASGPCMTTSFRLSRTIFPDATPGASTSRGGRSSSARDRIDPAARQRRRSETASAGKPRSARGRSRAVRTATREKAAVTLTKAHSPLEEHVGTTNTAPRSRREIFRDSDDPQRSRPSRCSLSLAPSAENAKGDQSCAARKNVEEPELIKDLESADEEGEGRRQEVENLLHARAAAPTK